MFLLLRILIVSLTFFCLTSCHTTMRCNKWKEKDLYYSDYYQTPPIWAPPETVSCCPQH